MTKLIRLAIIALTLTAGATAAMARDKYDPYWTDRSQACGGYSCNSQEGSEAFWDHQVDH
jgi:hypothetical protein